MSHHVTSNAQPGFELVERAIGVAFDALDPSGGDDFTIGGNIRAINDSPSAFLFKACNLLVHGLPPLFGVRAGKGFSQRWEVRILGFLLGFHGHGAQRVLKKVRGLEHAWMHVQQSIGVGVKVGDLAVHELHSGWSHWVGQSKSSGKCRHVARWTGGKSLWFVIGLAFKCGRQALDVVAFGCAARIATHWRLRLRNGVSSRWLGSGQRHWFGRLPCGRRHVVFVRWFARLRELHGSGDRRRRLGLVKWLPWMQIVVEFSPLSQCRLRTAQQLLLAVLGTEPLIGQGRRGEMLIKISFVPLKDAEVFPLRWLRILVRVNSLKFIVKHDVELGRNVASAKVANEGNRLSMRGRGTKVLTASGTRLPTRNLPSLGGQARFENIGGASPDMGLTESLVVTCSSGEHFHGSNARLGIGSVVVQVGSVAQGHWPERGILGFRPH